MLNYLNFYMIAGDFTEREFERSPPFRCKSISTYKTVNLSL